MPLLGKTNLSVSKIGLGTVELGLAYGIGVKDIPSAKEADRILKTAVDLGITYFDTARGYGLAEERIGKSGIAHQPNIVIGTKCAQFLEKGEDPQGQQLEKKIRQEVEKSLDNLKVDSIQLLQLHGGSHKQIERGELIDILRRLQEEEKVQHVGIATRGIDAPLAAIQSSFFATVQTAYSILDQRMAKTVLPQAQSSQVGIINRSVLLKGALTPAAWHLPPELDPIKINAAKAADIAKSLNMDLPTLAFRFVLSNPAISCALIGTVKPQHLRSAIAAAEAGPLDNTTLAQLKELAIFDEQQVDPSHWPTIS